MIPCYGKGTRLVVHRMAGLTIWDGSDEYTVPIGDAVRWRCEDDAIPPLIDIPLRTVNAVLHLHRPPLHG